MEIAIINGSPKLGRSTSQLIAGYLASLISNGNQIETYHARQGTLTEQQFEKLQNSDVLFFAFPLYADSIPSHLLKLLIELEKRGFTNENVIVYCAVNNGFFEGKQNRVAIESFKNWCRAAHLIWGQAVGIGAGEMLPFVKDIPMGHGPNKNTGYALRCLADNILGKSTGEDRFVSPNWSRLLWKIQSSFLMWYPLAKANGLKRKELKSAKAAQHKKGGYP